jgi:transcription termination factor Rho
MAAPSIEAHGVLEILTDGSGFLRDPSRSYRPAPEDVFASREILQRLNSSDRRGNGSGLEGCEIDGLAAPPGQGGGRPQGGPPDRGRHGARHGRGAGGRHGGRGGGGSHAPRLQELRTINGVTPEEFVRRRPFTELTSIDPYQQIRLETDPHELSTRVIDILTPIGKGQRCLVVAPPRAGKTTLLQKIAAAITRNHPEIHLVVLLVDERPEEVTDMKRSVNGEVIASSSDDVARNHVSVARIVLERARRLVEVGRDVVILLDSLTRLARAHNAATPGTGRTLSGGLDARTMEQPRRLFGAARKAEEGGSLTVIATALIDTGSRMDDVIFQEFKGTGNMELVLDRSLFEQRIYPAVDIAKSGTRKEEKLFAPEDIPRIHRLRRALFELKPHDAMMKLLDKLAKYPSNAAFLKALDV